MSDSEKRRIQRIDLESPVGANLSGFDVAMLDLSTAGARVEHVFPMKAGRKVKLDFDWDGSVLTLQCEVVRCRLQKSILKPGSIVYHSGLRFVDPAEGSRARVREIVARIVSSRMRAQSGLDGAMA